MENLFIVFLADFLIYILFMGLMFLWFIDGKIKKEQVIHAFFACFIAWVIAIVIKHLFPTVRPYLTDGRPTEVAFLPTSGAFPSEHTIVAFALSVTVFMHDRKVGWFFITGALLIGIARVLANVHYPTDIVGGAFLGTIVAVIVERTHFANIFSKSSSKRFKNKK